MSAKDLTRNMPQPYMPSFDEIMEFIHDHNGYNTAFKKWSYNDVAQSLLQSLTTNCFFYSLNTLGMLQGVAVCKINSELLSVYVLGVVGNRSAMRDMLFQFFKRFPAWSISGRRHGNVRVYNAAQLYKQICKTNLITCSH